MLNFHVVFNSELAEHINVLYSPVSHIHQQQNASFHCGKPKDVHCTRSKWAILGLYTVLQLHKQHINRHNFVIVLDTMSLEIGDCISNIEFYSSPIHNVLWISNFSKHMPIMIGGL